MINNYLNIEERKTNIKRSILSKVDKIFVLDDSSGLKIDKILNLVAQKLKDNYNMIIFNPKNYEDDFSYELSNKIMQLCSFYNSIFLIKSRSDLVKIIKSDGIILDKNSLDINKIKKFLDNETLFGLIDEKNNINKNEFDFLIKYNKDNNKYSLEVL